ncbi:uncharacterized protein LOC128239450 [Mya arenaria]|uniref:uncharacterized protein LOC128239450 n=1 Tax=Mya arenaria TaxID=6604 RepID=UPI0022E23D1D|nr:uncharacterized protein LOC128239450 [Mya arenaria]
MGVKFYKVTGILLSVTVVVLGAVTTIVLYFAGQSAIDFFYTGTTRDVDGRIHRRQLTDDWYGVFFLRGWAFGFVYITPGIYGIASSLFFNKCLMGVSVVVETLAVTAGSFLHSVGALGLLHYYFVVSEGASKHDPFLTDCFFSKMQTTDTYPIQPVPVNERCEQGRKLFASSYTKCLDHRKKILLQRKHRQHVLTVQYGWNQREFAGEDKGRHDRWRRHQTLTDRPTSVWRRVPGLRTPAGHSGQHRKLE